MSLFQKSDAVRSFSRTFIFILFAASCFAFSLPVSGQVEPERHRTVTRILFVMDASQSMYGRWQSDMKITIARRLLSNLLDSLEGVRDLELALRLYGHQFQFPPQVCNDTRLVVPFGENNIPAIKQKLSTLTPKGTTPIAYALEQAGYDFPVCDHCRNIIILITDGIEECGGDPCAVSRELQKKGLILKPFIIGIGRNFEEAFDCVGTYYDASDERQFTIALNVVISQALNSTTAQVNLLDAYGKPTETNVNMTLYDNFSGLVKYNFIHTMNNKGLPDTLVIDPLLAYDITIHTIPPVHIDSVKLNPGKHTVIAAEAPQGFLDLRLETRDMTVKDLKCIVRRNGDHNTLNVQQFGQTEKYITGTYDLEVLCLPRMVIEDVEIIQSHTTTVEIPLPGIAVILKNASGYGSLFVEEDNELRWIHNFRDAQGDRETLILQPGNYRAVFRSRSSTSSLYTVEESFVVEPGKSVNVKLY